MGEVYRARDTRLEREVAVKVLPEGVAASSEDLALFEHEARAVAVLNHPNIVALHDVGTADGVSFAVSELLEGQTLRQRLDADGPIPPRKALDIATQIAKGLAGAHERGIVHRDIKPENLFVTNDGRAKILDFGIAVRVTQRASMDTTATLTTRTDAGKMTGTVGYMAPEQIRGEATSMRSDLFAFGVVVYEILTGKNPFKRETAVESMTAILREHPPPLSRVVSGLPAGVAKLIERCLEKRPEDRPESTRDLSLYLEALDADSTVASPTSLDASTLPEVTGSVRRRIVATICALLLALTALTWGYVRVMGDRVVGDTIEADLARAQGLVVRAHAQRLERLRLTARLVASFPELKALFETDAATIRDFLRAYQERNPGTPLLVALGPDGHALARTDQAALGTSDEGADWLEALVGVEGSAGVISVAERPYHAAASASEAGGNIFGHIIAAAPVDDTFAQALRETTEDEIVLLDSRSVLGSTFRAGQVPWTSLDAWRASGGTSDARESTTIGTQRFAAREVPLTTTPPLSAIVVASRDEAIGPYQQIQRGLLLLGLVAMIAAFFGSAWLARWITTSLIPRTSSTR